jgi:uroporphyrinogen decarboxylase
MISDKGGRPMMLRPQSRKPDFRQLGAVLEKRIPERPVLFELFTNNKLISDISGMTWKNGDTLARDIAYIKANDFSSYDYAVVLGSDFDFPKAKRHSKNTVSLNEGAMITDRKSFDAYKWPDPDAYDYSRLDKLTDYLPNGMELMVWSPDGLLELVIRLTGYENLCLMLYDDPQLVYDIFEQAGRRFLRYFEKCLEYKRVVAVISSDDWGFNTQTLISISHMRELLFPWQCRLVEIAHKSGRYAILHSCGKFENILDDIIKIGFDAKHSYEDNIWPVEQAYEKMYERIGVLGGIDMDFMVRRSEDEIYSRAKEMLDRTAKRGGYALGTGNSVPEYVPNNNYFSMLKAAFNY